MCSAPSHPSEGESLLEFLPTSPPSLKVLCKEAEARPVLTAALPQKPPEGFGTFPGAAPAGPSPCAARAGAVSLTLRRAARAPGGGT